MIAIAGQTLNHKASGIIKKNKGQLKEEKENKQYNPKGQKKKLWVHAAMDDDADDEP